MNSKPHPPQRPFFSSGPTAKYSGWQAADLKNALVGRNHRSADGLTRINTMLDLVRALLDVPTSHHIALVPGSATGGFEMLLWNLLGQRPIDSLVHDVFSMRWHNDITQQLCLDNVNLIQAAPGHLPDITQINFDHDVVLNWNGTTTGVRYPGSDFILEGRQGLVIADLTSAVFCEAFDWTKFDAAAFSWQKGLGGEAAHGIIIVNDRALTRLAQHEPKWPIPYVFSMHKNQQINLGLFKGQTLNTPSMLCVEDYIQALQWAERQGGAAFLKTRLAANCQIALSWVNQQNWCDYLASDLHTRSYSTHCFKITESWFQNSPVSEQWLFLKKVAVLLSQENMVFDCVNHIDSVPSFRLWGGPTIEATDLQAALNCLTWAYHQCRAEVTVVS